MFDLFETGLRLSSLDSLVLGDTVLLKVLLGNRGVFGEITRSVVP